MIIILFFFIFLLRAWILFNSSYTFYSDDAIYAILARSWVEGEWRYVFHPTWPPLYPAVSAAISLFLPNFENASRFTALIFGTALIIPLFFLLRKTTSKAEAVSFIISICLFTPLLTLSLLPLSDSLAVFLIILGIVLAFFSFFHFNTRLGIKLLLLCSFVFGLVFLTRTEGTMFFFLTLGYLIFFGVLRNRSKMYLLTILFFVAVFFITISPYVVATKYQIGEWSLSQKFSAQLQQGHMFSLNKQGTTWAQEIDSARFPDYNSLYYKNGTKYLLDRLYNLIHSYPEKQSKWSKVFLSIFPIWSLPMILLGAVAGLLKKRFMWSGGYIIFLLLSAIPITIFSTPMQDIRYLAWVVPIALYLFYRGVKVIIPREHFAAVIAFVAVLAFPGVSVTNLINPKLVATSFSNVYNKNELKDVGLWIKNNSGSQGPKLMMRHEGVEFYSRGETIYLPQANLNEVLDYARKNKVDYLIAWEEELANDEQLKILLDRETEHPGLQEVYFTKGKNQIIVYTFKTI